MIDDVPCSRSRIRTGTSTQPEPVLEHEERRLDLRIVARVVLGEQRDRRGGSSAWKPEVVSVTRCRVSSETRRAKNTIPDPARERRPIAGVAVREARARDDVRLAGLERREQLRQLGRIVLPVAVEPHRDVVAPLEREAKARLHGARRCRGCTAG